jgi:predicted secreted hydrolase
MKQKNKPIKFPEDELAHKFIVEWWYFNGFLKDKDNNKYSFMDCLFKVDIKKIKIPFLSKALPKISYFSHSLITDLNKKIFYHRLAPFSIISDDSFSKPALFINYLNPKIKTGYSNCVIERLDEVRYHIKNEDLDLTLTSTKKPLLEGGVGYLDFHPQTTYYYSLTSLKTEGRIKVRGRWIEVAGKSWMDHQWSNAKGHLNKWDWFSVQLDNNIELVCFVFNNGKQKTYFADISYANNKQEHYQNLKITPLKKYWTSPKSKAVYPIAWQIEIPAKKIKLNLTAELDNQEMLSGSINYWEGPLRVAGYFGEKRVKGVGFMELVGYPSEYSDIKYINDGLIRVAGRLAAIAKKEALHLTRNLKNKFV